MLGLSVYPAPYLTQRLLTQRRSDTNLTEPIALKGKTPSEACGIEVNGDNKWITLIQNARKTESI
jgi:hypothetical protein